MKANEAPEKIYISNFDIDALPKCEQLSERWHEVSTQDTDIEYIRTDAFIEKACKAYCKMCKMSNCRVNECKFIEDFVNHIKGE